MTLTLVLLFSFAQGTHFDYPKKGKNIPPSKYDAPPKEEPADGEGDEDAGEDGDRAPSYYDEDGNRVDGGEGHHEDDGYGEEQPAYGEEADYGEEGH